MQATQISGQHGDTVVSTVTSQEEGPCSNPPSHSLIHTFNLMREMVKENEREP